MNRQAIAVLVDGQVLRLVDCLYDGDSLIEKKSRRKYVVKSSPMHMTRRYFLGTRAVNVFLASTETATTFPPPWLDEKQVVKFADGQSLVLTPENLFEISDPSDLKALNLSQGIPWLIVWLSLGAGAGGMMILFLLFQTISSTHAFGLGK